MVKLLLLSLLGILAVTPIFATELLQNPGFETGQLSPWYPARDYCGHGCDDWHVDTQNPHSGTYDVAGDGLIELRQDFTPTPGSSISNVSFWVITGVNNVGLMDFFYTDNTDEEFSYSANDNQWTLVNATAEVDKSKVLMGFSVWGYSFPGAEGSSNVDYFYDDFDITATPEPGSLVLLGTGLLGLGVRVAHISHRLGNVGFSLQGSCRSCFSSIRSRRHSSLQ